MMMSSTMAVGFSSCSSDNDNPKTEFPPYMEENNPSGLQSALGAGSVMVTFELI